MIAKVDRTTGWGVPPEYKEFTTLEDLLAFMKQVDCRLIVSEPSGFKIDKPHDFCIEIYDGYRE